MQIRNIDLLEIEADVIVQQCNCVTVRPHGLSANISERFPYADLYGKRTSQSRNFATKETRSIPGTCVLAKPEAGVHGPIVACLMGQVAPGKCGSWAAKYKVNHEDDSSEMRQIYFKSALHQLADLSIASDWSQIAFPFNIGGGLAGGYWPTYPDMLREFDSVVTKNGIQVFVCKREQM